MLFALLLKFTLLAKGTFAFSFSLVQGRKVRLGTPSDAPRRANWLFLRPMAALSWAMTSVQLGDPGPCLTEHGSRTAGGTLVAPGMSDGTSRRGQPPLSDTHIPSNP